MDDLGECVEDGVGFQVLEAKDEALSDFLADYKEGVVYATNGAAMAISNVVVEYAAKG